MYNKLTKKMRANWTVRNAGARRRRPLAVLRRANTWNLQVSIWRRSYNWGHLELRLAGAGARPTYPKILPLVGQSYS